MTMCGIVLNVIPARDVPEKIIQAELSL